MNMLRSCRSYCWQNVDGDDDDKTRTTKFSTFFLKFLYFSNARVTLTVESHATLIPDKPKKDNISVW